MKRITLITLSVVLVALLIFSAWPVLAAKPPQVITVSNGFPSGMHFNLNIHGKNPETFTTPDPPWGPPWGNSIFIPEFTADYEQITIEVISNKKGGTEFEVIDPYAMPSKYENGDPTNFENADDLAQFNLPYKIQTDDGVVNSNGYYVYGRILGKPNNSATSGEPSNILVTTNPILQVDSDGATFPLGLVTTKGSYLADDGYFIRFDDNSSIPNGKGKGRSIAKNITDMFMWTGWVVDGSLDTNGPDGIPDGVIDEYDVPGSYDTLEPFGEITQEELNNWLEDMADLDLARYYEDWWVFDIAEMVTQSWDIENDGTKLLQIRFYPVATTTFTEKAHIVVNKVTDPADDTTTLFDFEATYRNPWQMTSDQFSLSHGLDAGSYEVTELAEDGWDLTGIIIEDPTGGSTYDGSTVTIDLAEGETVTITFINTQRGQIIVEKVTDPSGEADTFEFTAEYYTSSFYLADGQSNDSGWLEPGEYDLAEVLPPSPWALTDITITTLDSSDTSIKNVATGETTIDLDPGETVTVTFTNEEQIE
jgi:hypothetical protein